MELNQLRIHTEAQHHGIASKEVPQCSLSQGVSDLAETENGTRELMFL